MRSRPRPHPSRQAPRLRPTWRSETPDAEPGRRSARGQAATFVLLSVAVLLVAIALAVGSMGSHAVDRTRAQTAADAAALASLDGGRSAAERLAADHGAVVVDWHRGPGPRTVTVTVRIGDTTATARARGG